MRPTLNHASTERRRRHIAAPWRRSRDVELPPLAAGAAPDDGKRVVVSSLETTLNSDSTARRDRAAGGPVDMASYNCSCGLVFSASVSTTVACPHCGTEQAW